MKLKFNIPTNWNKLSDKQLYKVANLMFSKLPTVYFDYKLFTILANRKWWKFRLIWKINILFKQVPIKTIKEDFSYIYKNQNLTRFINKVKINKVIYYAPSNRLTNLSIGEFSVCEDLYLKYLQNCKNSKSNFGYTYALALFSVLYIPEASAKRPEFLKELLNEKIKKTADVNKKYVLAALLSYKGCREAITSNKKYKHIFPDRKARPKSPLKFPSSSGFSDIILSFSGKQFGSYLETFNINLYTFLDGFEVELKKLKQLEAQNTK